MQAVDGLIEIKDNHVLEHGKLEGKLSHFKSWLNYKQTLNLSNRNCNGYKLTVDYSK